MYDTELEENIVDETVEPGTEESQAEPQHADSNEETAPSGEVSIEDLSLDLVSALPSDEVTPYQIHTVVNTMFDALGSSRTVRPQMMYNYDSNGLIVKGKKAAKRYTREEAAAFAVKFVTKHTTN